MAAAASVPAQYHPPAFDGTRQLCRHAVQGRRGEDACHHDQQQGELARAALDHHRLPGRVPGRSGRLAWRQARAGVAHDPAGQTWSRKLAR